MINQIKRISSIQAETDGFNIYPNTDRSSKTSVWRGRAEVHIASKNFAAASKLASQLANRMQVQNMNLTLSHEARMAAEAKLIDQAVNSFRDKTLMTTKLFGCTSYTIRDVHVSEDSNNPGPCPMMRVAAAPAPFNSMPVSIEGGKTQVTVTISGAVQMLK